MKKKILVVDDDLDLGMLLKNYLKGEGFAPDTALDGSKALQMIAQTDYDLVLSDFRLPDKDGLELLAAIKKTHPLLPIILVTGYSDVRTAVAAMKQGAADFVTKPIIPDELLQRIKKVLEQSQAPPSPAPAKAAPPKPREELDENTIFTGSSASFQQVLDHIDLVGPTDMSVIIEGKTGSGKEVVAKMLHRSSKRAEKPYFAVDCGAIPSDLAASELFGHVKGAFTGALRNHDGYFLQADGGTLFLDEIGNLSYDIQVQLLRVLQEGVLRKVGDSKVQRTDVRVIVATNESLLEMVGKGKFREDLYYRLNEFRIRVPALRERAEDLEGFAAFFLEKANAQLGKSVAGFTEGALKAIRNYPWPGNLREMGNVVKRAVLLTKGDHVDERALPEEVLFHGPEEEIATALHSAQHDSDLKNASANAELEVILETLRRCKFNRSKAARELGIDRKTLYNKLKAGGVSL